VDSIGLVHVLKQLNKGKDWAGNSIGRATRFFVAIAANPNALDLAKEKERFRRKLEAGGDVVMTQPLYDRASVERFFEEFGPIPVPVLLGVLPVQSFRHAEFLHNEVPGIEIPAYLRERMRRAGENGLAEGIVQAREFLADVHELVQGIYLMPSFGRYEVVAEVAKGVVF
jgi:homocysteine S-methyltransferase